MGANSSIRQREKQQQHICCSQKFSWRILVFAISPLLLVQFGHLTYQRASTGPKRVDSYSKAKVAALQTGRIAAFASERNSNNSQKFSWRILVFAISPLLLVQFGHLIYQRASTGPERVDSYSKAKVAALQTGRID